MQLLNRVSAEVHYQRSRLRRVLCHWRYALLTLCTGTYCYGPATRDNSTASSVVDWQMLCRCHVFTKRLSHAKQALATSFNQVSVASATFQLWRQLASLSSHASAATSALGSLEHLGSVAASEGSTPGIAKLLSKRWLTLCKRIANV